MKRHLRYVILLSLLAFVAINEAVLKMRSTSWARPLQVHLYAVSGDGRTASETYVDALTTESFLPIQNFVNREAERYNLPFKAIEVFYHGRLQSHPPQPPSGQNIFENMLWSLQFRAWAWRRAWSSEHDDGDVELFLSYYDIESTSSLRHSVGLRGGLIGLINAFAAKPYQGSNHVVIVHELMHTLGALDRYDATTLPLYPEGYAEPFRKPLYPQRKAEIMGGRIPLSPQSARMPEKLSDVTIGKLTALEIRWIE